MPSTSSIVKIPWVEQIILQMENLLYFLWAKNLFFESMISVKQSSSKMVKWDVYNLAYCLQYGLIIEIWVFVKNNL